MDPVIYKYHQPFTLESGISLPKLKIAYHYYGEYTPGKKVAWVCHALTANSDVADWWKGLVGEDNYFNPKDVSDSKMLITGGGTLNKFLLECIEDKCNLKIVIPQKEIIDFKEAIIFGFLGVLRMRNEVNCLRSVTGASVDSSGGEIF